MLTSISLLQTLLETAVLHLPLCFSTQHAHLAKMLTRSPEHFLLPLAVQKMVRDALYPQVIFDLTLGYNKYCLLHKNVEG